MLVTKIRSRGFFMYLFEHYFFSLIAPVAMINRLFFTNSSYDLRFTISHLEKKKLQIIVILLWEKENCLLGTYLWKKKKIYIFTKVFLKVKFHHFLIGYFSRSELFTSIILKLSYYNFLEKILQFDEKTQMNILPTKARWTLKRQNSCLKNELEMWAKLMRFPLKTKLIHSAKEVLRKLQSINQIFVICWLQYKNTILNANFPFFWAAARIVSRIHNPECLWFLNR